MMKLFPALHTLPAPLLAAALLSACGPAGLGGQSGSELDPEGTVEEGTTQDACGYAPITGPQTESEGPAEGFENSFAELAGPYEGEWIGALRLEGEDDEVLSLSIDVDADSTPFTSEAGCSPYYEATATVVFLSDASLDEVVEVSMRFQDNLWALLQADIAEGDLVGDIERRGDTLLLSAGGRDTLFGDVAWSTAGLAFDPVGDFEVSRADR